MAVDAGFLRFTSGRRGEKDLISTRVHVLVVMMLATLATAAQASPTHRMLDSSTETGTRKPEHRHRNRHHNKSTDKHCPQGYGGLVDGGAHCCANGGVPVLGRCACPRNFGGDYCEFRKRGCMEIPHGGVFTQNCALCTCQYGIVSCIPRAFSNCEHLVVDEDDDGSMKTYDFRSKDQREAALSQLPILLIPTRPSGQPQNRVSIQAVSVTLLTTLLLLCGGL